MPLSSEELSPVGSKGRSGGCTVCQVEMRHGFGLNCRIFTSLEAWQHSFERGDRRRSSFQTIQSEIQENSSKRPLCFVALRQGSVMTSASSVACQSASSLQPWRISSARASVAAHWLPVHPNISNRQTRRLVSNGDKSHTT